MRYPEWAGAPHNSPMISSASSRVMTVTVNFTRRVYRAQGSGLKAQAGHQGSGLKAQGSTSGRHRLDGLECHERAVVGNDRVQFGELRAREIALRLEQLERR